MPAFVMKKEKSARRNATKQKCEGIHGLYCPTDLNLSAITGSVIAAYDQFNRREATRANRNSASHPQSWQRIYDQNLAAEVTLQIAAIFLPAGRHHRIFRNPVHQ